MSRLISNKHGFSLIEAVIAMGITMFAVMAIFSLVAPSWRASTQADEMGRAAHLLYAQLQREEIHIMNPRNLVTTGVTGPNTVYASGGVEPYPAGDIPFSVTTTITAIDGTTWQVAVTVTWRPNHPGISDELIVTRQDNFRAG